MAKNIIPEWYVNPATGQKYLITLESSGSAPVGADKTIVTLDGGEYVAHPVTAGKTYTIDSESMDVYVATASSPNIYGSTFATGEAVRNTNITNLDNAAFQWGTSDLSFEMWTTIDVDSAAFLTAFVVGHAATAEVRLYLKEDTGTGYIYSGSFAEDTGGATEWSTGHITSAIPNESGRMYHIVLTLERTVEAKLYIDGTLVNTVLDAAFTSGDGGGSVNFAATGEAVLCGSINGTAQFEGAVNTLKAYESLLTASQIAELNKYGPGYFPTTVYPAFTIDFALDAPTATRAGNWTNADQPELFTYDGTTRTKLAALDADIGTYDASDSLAVITGNDVARFGINSRIRANTPTMVTIPAGVTHLLLWSKPASAGDVEIFG